MPVEGIQLITIGKGKTINWRGPGIELAAQCEVALTAGLSSTAPFPLSKKKSSLSSLIVNISSDLEFLQSYGL